MQPTAPAAASAAAAPAAAPAAAAAAPSQYISTTGNNIGKILMNILYNLTDITDLCEYDMNKPYAPCKDPPINDNGMIAVFRIYIIVVAWLLTSLFLFIMYDYDADDKIENRSKLYWGVGGVIIYFISNIIFFHFRLIKKPT